MKCIPDNVFKALPVLKQTQRVTDDQLRDLVNIVDEAEGLELPLGFGRD